MKKKIMTLLTLLAVLPALLLCAGCLPEEEEEFDEAALLAVNEYVREMSLALTDTIVDLKGWKRDYYEEDLPLRYDEERRQWLKEHLENIAAVQKMRLEEGFPAEEEIAAWQVVVERGEKEWLLAGSEAIEALQRLELLHREVTGTIEMIVKHEGELDMEQSEQVLVLIETIEPEVEAVKAFFFR